MVYFPGHRIHRAEKNVLSHKNHMAVTQGLAEKLLARGVLDPFQGSGRKDARPPKVRS